MIDKTKLKHIVVFICAFALLSIVPLALIHLMTNIIDTTLIQNDAVLALMITSPMASCVGGIAIAMLYVCRHPEIL